jgi:molybdopterin-guanine dinucleotide biosynthesis protein A
MLSELGDYDLVIPRDQKHFHPLAAVYRTYLEDPVRRLIAEERMRPLFLVEESNSRIIETEQLRDVDPNLDSLRNTNTVEEYRRALADAGFDDAAFDLD